MWKSAKTRHGFLSPALGGQTKVPVVNPPCPWLPQVDEIHDHTITRRHGRERGAAFYQDALRYAQSQWISGKPAQAILQLDKAWMADPSPDDPVWRDCPAPYSALVWIISRSAAGTCGYLGNPVRHFQHLASRMSGPRSGLRSWRAWCCMHLAERVSFPGLHPRDGRQLAREGLWIPRFESTLSALHRMGWSGEIRQIRMALETDPAKP